MTYREHLEATLAGRIVDRIPAVFRLDNWYNARAHAGDLPGEWAGMSLRKVEAHLGLGRSARAGIVFNVILRSPVECVETRKDDLIITEWHTSGRSLRWVRRYGPGDEAAGLSPTTLTHPIQCVEDYAAYEEVMRHTEFVPTYDDYLRYDRMIGDRGMPMVILGPIPFHDLLVRWSGYEQGYLHLYDHPDVVLRAADVANQTYRRMWEVVAESPARLVMHGVNFDTKMTSPPIFREHFLPYLKQFNRRMHEAGKQVAFHADGDMSGLLELVLQADYDVADCFACSPLVPCTMTQARSAWRDRITIWGGLPSSLLEPPVPLEQLRAHLSQVYQAVAPGERFILGISDQAMPTASWKHIALAAQWAREHDSLLPWP